MRELSELYQLGLQLIELELEAPRNEYRRVMPPRMASAAIPFVRSQELSGAEPKPRSASRRISHALFRHHISRALGLQPLIEIVSSVTQHGASRVLRVGSASGLLGSAIDRIPGSHVWVSAAGMSTGNFAKAFATAPTFDLCICDLDYAELLELSSLVAVITPFMTARGTILAYHCNQVLAELPPDAALVTGVRRPGTVHIYRTGFWPATFLVPFLRRAEYLYDTRKYLELSRSLLKVAIRIVVATPIILLRQFLVPQRSPLHLRKSIVIQIVLA